MVFYYNSIIYKIFICKFFNLNSKFGRNFPVSQRIGAFFLVALMKPVLERLVSSIIAVSLPPTVRRRTLYRRIFARPYILLR